MFGQIAGRYDFLNHLLSLGIDHYWRWRTVRTRAALGLAPDPRCLHRHRRPGARVRPRSRPENANRRRRFLSRNAGDRRGRKRISAGADVSHRRSSKPTPKSLPVPSDAFQIVCVAFGLRNVADTDRGLAEMTRACAPDGHVAVLEFSTPTWQPFKSDLRLVLSQRPTAHRQTLRARFRRRLRVSADQRRRIPARRSTRRPHARRRPRPTSVAIRSLSAWLHFM